MKQYAIIKQKIEEYNIRNQVYDINTMISSLEDTIISSMGFTKEFKRYSKDGGCLEYLENLCIVIEKYKDIIEQKMIELIEKVEEYRNCVEAIKCSILQIADTDYDNRILLITQMDRIEGDEDEVNMPTALIINSNQIESNLLHKVGINYNIHILTNDEIEKQVFTEARNRYKNSYLFDR